MFIDTHAHLFYPNFNDDLDDVVLRAKEAGVDYIIVPATNIETAEATIRLTEKYDMVYGCAGVHPHDTKDWDISFENKLKSLQVRTKL
jgi:TatD DNase family protein